MNPLHRQRVIIAVYRARWNLPGYSSASAIGRDSHGTEGERLVHPGPGAAAGALSGAFRCAGR